MSDVDYPMVARSAYEGLAEIGGETPYRNEYVSLPLCIDRHARVH